MARLVASAQIELDRCLAEYRAARTPARSEPGPGRRTEYSGEDIGACRALLQGVDAVEANAAFPRPQKEDAIASIMDQVRSCIDTRRRHKAAGAAAEARAKEESEAVANAEAESERVATEKHDSLAADPIWMKPVLSALLCYDDWLNKASKDEIGKEQLYARKGGGMVDVGKIYELQQHMRKATENKATASSRLRKMKLKPLACSIPTVQAIAMCMRDEPGDWCEGEHVKDRIDFVDVPEGPTWTCRGSNCD